MGLVEFKNVGFQYSGEQILKNISLDVKEGEIIGVAGAIGSGKTSLLKLINGLNKPSRGEVLINLLSTLDYTVGELSRHIGFVFQNPQEQLFQRKVKDEILFSLRYKNTPEYFMESRLKIVSKLLNLEDILDKKISNLPYYKKKIIAIASVLIEDKDILVLDEPVQGLDIHNRHVINRMMNELRKDRKTVFVSSNDLYFLMDNVDKVILLDNHELVGFDTFNNLFEDEDIDYLDMDRPIINSLSSNIFGRNDIFKEKDFIEIVKEKYYE